MVFPFGAALAADPSVAPPPAEVVAAWDRSAGVSRIGLGAMLVGGSVRAVGGGLSLLAVGAEELEPLSEGTNAASGSVLALGAMGTAAGALGAAGVARRGGTSCPAWSGIVAIPAGLAGIGLTLTPLVVEATSGEPLPAPLVIGFGYAALLPVPFAVLQADAAEGCARRAGWPELPADRGLLELTVLPSPSGAHLVGRF